MEKSVIRSTRRAKRKIMFPFSEQHTSKVINQRENGSQIMTKPQFACVFSGYERAEKYVYSSLNVVVNAYIGNGEKKYYFDIRAHCGNIRNQYAKVAQDQYISLDQEKEERVINYARCMTK